MVYDRAESSYLQHEPYRQLLGQRPDGKLFGYDESGVAE